MDGVQDLIDSIPTGRINPDLFKLFNVLPRICRESPAEAAAACLVLCSTIGLRHMDCEAQLMALTRLAERYSGRTERESVVGIPEAPDCVSATVVDGNVRLNVSTEPDAGHTLVLPVGNT